MVRLKQTGFTIIELLIVVVVIGILAAITMVAYSGVQARAKDSRRVNDMQAISIALNLYKTDNVMYPNSSGNGPGGWESSSITPSQFLTVLKTGKYLPTVPVDPVNNSTQEYRYYRYGAGSYGCDPTRGAYFVLGSLDMEASDRPSSTSPGWSCSGRNWQGEFDWVMGGFEN